MGLLKKITQPVSKVLDKIIPNEVKPFLPYLAAAAPYLYSGGLGGTSILQQMIRRGALSGALNLGSQLAQEGSEGDFSAGSVGLAGLQGALTTADAAKYFTGQRVLENYKPELASQGQAAVGEKLSMLDKAKNIGLGTLEKGAQYASGISETLQDPFGGSLTKFGKAAIIPFTQGSTDLAMANARLALKNYEDELSEFNKQAGTVTEASNLNRRNAIISSMKAAAFDQETIDATLAQLGLKDGGRVGAMNGGIMNAKRGLVNAPGGYAGEKYLNNKGFGGITEAVKNVENKPKKFLVDNLEVIVNPGESQEKAVLNAIFNDVNDVMPQSRKEEFYRLLIPKLRERGEISENEYKALMGEVFSEGKKYGGRVGYAEAGSVDPNNQYTSDIFGLGSPELVNNAANRISKGVDSILSKTANKIMLDDQGNFVLPIQYLRKFGEDTIFGGQKNPYLSEKMYNKLGKKYIEEMKETKNKHKALLKKDAEEKEQEKIKSAIKGKKSKESKKYGGRVGYAEAGSVNSNNQDLFERFIKEREKYFKNQDKEDILRDFEKFKKSQEPTMAAQGGIIELNQGGMYPNIYNPNLAKGGRVGYQVGGRATTQDFAKALQSVSAGTTDQQNRQAFDYARQEAAGLLNQATSSNTLQSLGSGSNKSSGLQNIYDTFFSTPTSPLPNTTFYRRNFDEPIYGYANKDYDKMLDVMANQMLSTTAYAPIKKNSLQLKIENNKKIYDEYLKNQTQSLPMAPAPLAPYQDKTLLDRLKTLTSEEALQGETFQTLSDIDQYNFSQTFPQLQSQLRDPSYVSPYGLIGPQSIFNTQYGLKKGGIASLNKGGMIDFGGREMDMRGGGFIPIGAKERADDVPARLSKNEFVMTANAVRAAGGGSINQGAKRMYDLMNNLEARV